MSRSRAPVPFLAAALALLVASGAAAQTSPANGGSSPEAILGAPIYHDTEEIEWSEGPPSLPAGAEFAILEGDPSEAVPLTFRLRFPPGYEVPPHYHSVIEHVTVFRGTLHIGEGADATREGAIPLGPGDFAALPAKMVHCAWAGPEGVEFQLHSVGPWSITYVDPADDPRGR